MKTQCIHIEDFLVTDTVIDVDANGENFQINREEFETYCDQNDLREWDEDVYNQALDVAVTSEGTISWSDVYADSNRVKEFLTEFIKHILNQNSRISRDN